MNTWKKWDCWLKWLSALTLIVSSLYIGLRLALPLEVVVLLDGVAVWVLPILLAGAVGYLTNWIALWYLFKPYAPHWGGRFQGIIPRQKREMAVSFGVMVGKKLLNPETLVEEMKSEVLAFVRSAQRTAKLREWLLKVLINHEAELVELVTPFLERQVFGVIDQVATNETWAKLLDEGLLPRLQQEASRGFIVQKLVEALRENAGGIIEEVRGELRLFLKTRLNEKLPLGLGADMLTEYVMDHFADEESLKVKLDGWLQRETTQMLLRDKLLEYANQVTQWMKGEEGRKMMQGLTHELKVRGKRFLRLYLREKMSEMMSQVFASPFWQKTFEQVLLPKFGDKVAQFISENKLFILNKLRLEQRVTAAVNRMDIATFHQTLNEFMATNFCAVQVLGFLLGAFIGAIQLLIKLG